MTAGGIGYPNTAPEGCDLIYALRDPRDQSLRYIGRTKNLRIRLGGHIAEARSGMDISPPKNAWIRELLDGGLKPGIIVVQCCSEDDAAERERFWIKHYAGMGYPLLNIEGLQSRAPGAGRKHTNEKRGPLLDRTFGVYADQVEYLEKQGRRLKGGRSEYLRRLVDADRQREEGGGG